MDDGAADEQTEWAREEQQMIMQQQDHTIDAISGTLSTLAEQAGLIGREIVEHNECVSLPAPTRKLTAAQAAERPRGRRRQHECQARRCNEEAAEVHPRH
jgi:hypothetical protein